MYDPSILDLVRYNGAEMIVVSAPADGKVALATPDWPTEFSEIDDFDPATAISVDLGSIDLIEPAAARFELFNAKIIEVGDNADQREGWDWNEVSELLLAATQILPRMAVTMDLNKGHVDLAGDIDGDLADLVRPAAAIIATHAIGSGEADVEDLSEALQSARALQAPAPRP